MITELMSKYAEDLTKRDALIAGGISLPTTGLLYNSLSNSALETYKDRLLRDARETRANQINNSDAIIAAKKSMDSASDKYYAAMADAEKQYNKAVATSMEPWNKLRAQYPNAKYVREIPGGVEAFNLLNKKKNEALQALDAMRKSPLYDEMRVACDAWRDTAREVECKANAAYDEAEKRIAKTKLPRKAKAVALGLSGAIAALPSGAYLAYRKFKNSGAPNAATITSNR